MTRIRLSDLNNHKYPTTPEIEANLAILLDRVNKLQDAYGKPLLITSGLRSEAQQQGLIAAGKSTATKSRHLIGAAADIADKLGLLYDWAKANEPTLVALGIWCEERMGGWLHCQILQPLSGKRWFWP